MGAQYTALIEDIVKSYGGYNVPIRTAIKNARAKIFNFTYPIWSESYRSELEEKLLLHWIAGGREISCDTVLLWQLQMEDKLNLIMPKYNELYKTLVNYDITKDHTIVTETHSEENSLNVNSGSSNTTTTGNANDTSTNSPDLHNVSIESDFPQGYAAAGDINTGVYATKMNDIKNDGTNQTVSASDNVNDSESDDHREITDDRTGDVKTTVTGNNTYIADLIAKYRAQIIVINQMIFDDMSDCVLLLY